MDIITRLDFSCLFFLAQETFFSAEAYYSRLLDDKGEKLSKIDFFGIR